MYVFLCVKVCLCARAHLVDTLDCLFDRGWVYKWEPWRDTLLDSLQEITDTDTQRKHQTQYPLTHTLTGRAVFGAEQVAHRWRPLKKTVCIDNPGWLNVSYIQTQRHACQHAVGGDKSRNISGGSRHVHGGASAHHAQCCASAVQHQTNKDLKIKKELLLIK